MTKSEDDIIGQFTKYQGLIWICACLTQVPAGIHAVISVFALAKPDYRCRTCFDDLPDSQIKYADYTDEFRQTFYQSSEGKCGTVIDQCYVTPDVTANTTSTPPVIETCCYNEAHQCTEAVFQGSYSGYDKCDEYIYDLAPHGSYESTVITEFDMVCENAWLGDLASSLYYAGFGLGGITTGILADRFGRKPMIIIFGILMTCFGILVSFSTSPTMFIAARVLTGFCANGAMIPAYSLGIEVLGADWRGFAGLANQYFFAFGELILGGFAFWLRDWHDLCLAISFVAVPAWVSIIFLPESWRWQVSAGKIDVAKKNVQALARKSRGAPLNTTEADELDQIVDRMAKESGGDQPKSNLVDLFKDPTMRWVTLNLMYNWFTNSMVYYGLSLNAGSLPGTDYFNNTINALMEFPAYIIFPFLINKKSKLLGRRGTLGTFLIAGGVSCLISTICLEFKGCEEGDPLELTGQIFAYIGKFCLSGTFAIDYVISGEIYPAELRTNGIAICSFAARIAGVLSPFVIGSIADVASWLPGAIFAFLGLSSGALTFLLPETVGKPLSTTLAEAKQILFS